MLTLIVDYEGSGGRGEVPIVGNCQVKLIQCRAGACHMQSRHLQNCSGITNQLYISRTTTEQREGTYNLQRISTPV